MSNTRTTLKINGYEPHDLFFAGEYNELFRRGKLLKIFLLANETFAVFMVPRTFH